MSAASWLSYYRRVVTGPTHIGRKLNCIARTVLPEGARTIRNLIRCVKANPRWIADPGQLIFFQSYTGHSMIFVSASCASRQARAASNQRETERKNARGQQNIRLKIRFDS
jgi:hypothetical protein